MAAKKDDRHPAALVRRVWLYRHPRSRQCGLVLGPLSVVWCAAFWGLCRTGAQPWLVLSAPGPGCLYLRLGPLGLCWTDVEGRYW